MIVGAPKDERRPLKSGMERLHSESRKSQSENDTNGLMFDGQQKQPQDPVARSTSRRFPAFEKNNQNVS